MPRCHNPEFFPGGRQCTPFPREPPAPLAPPPGATTTLAGDAASGSAAAAAPPFPPFPPFPPSPPPPPPIPCSSCNTSCAATREAPPWRSHRGGRGRRRGAGGGRGRSVGHMPAGRGLRLAGPGGGRRMVQARIIRLFETTTRFQKSLIVKRCEKG